MSAKGTVLKPLRRLTFKRTLLTIVLPWVLVAVIMLASTGFTPGKAFKGATYAGSFEREKLEGEYVFIDDYYVLGETYEEWTEYDSGVTTAHKYYILVWVYTDDEDDGFYTTLKVDASDRNKLLRISEKQDEFFEKIAAGEDATWPVCIEYSGAMAKLNDDISDYTKELLKEIGETDYYINQPTVELVIDTELCSGLLDRDGVIALTYLSAFCLAVAVIIFLRSLGNAKLRNVKKFVKKAFDGDWNQAAVDFETAVRFGNCYITESCIYYMLRGNTKMFACKLEEIIWAYRHSVVTNGIAHNCVILHNRAKPKKAMNISVVKDNDIRTALEKLLREQEHIVIGYSDALDNMIKNDMSAFLAVAAKQRTTKDTAAVPADALVEANETVADFTVDGE